MDEESSSQEKISRYWVEMDQEGNPVFLFNNPDAVGMGQAIYLIKQNKLINPGCMLYYNNCRKITPGEYVTYRLLGIIDSNGRTI